MTPEAITQFRVAVQLQLVYFRRNMYAVILAAPPIVLFLLLCPGAAYRLVGEELNNQLWQQLVLLLQSLNWLLMMTISLLMGVVSISHEIRARSAKMILTRPVGFQIWISSRFLAGALVITVCSAVNLLLLEGLCWVAGADLVFDHAVAIALMVVSNIAVYSYGFFLSLWMPPVLAGFLAMIVNGPTVKIASSIAFGIRMMTKSSESASPVGETLVAATRALYVVIPDTFHSSSLVEFYKFFTDFPPGFLRNASWSLAYSVDLILLFYIFSSLILRRKNLP